MIRGGVPVWRIAVPKRRNTPIRTLAMIGANSLSAAVQAQFMFVLPWMLLARGSSPRVAALATAFVYVPMLVTAIPAGARSDNDDPVRLMRWVTVIPLVACALYPLASLAGRDWFWLLLVAAVVVGTTRNLSEGAMFRSLADTTRDEGLLRAHAIRTTLILLAGAQAVLVAPLLYCLFLLANSSAGASLGGARAAEVDDGHQGMLNLVIGTLGLAGFLIGVILVATLLGLLGYGIVLAVIGVAMTATALAFRRSLVAA